MEGIRAFLIFYFFWGGVLRTARSLDVGGGPKKGFGVKLRLYVICVSCGAVVLLVVVVLEVVPSAEVIGYNTHDKTVLTLNL